MPLPSEVAANACEAETRLKFAERFSNRADVTALLGAFCLFLSAIEYMLPKPMPFMRLGIANLPILLAVDILPFQWFIALSLVKVIGMSVISGSLFSFIALFSLAGTLGAALLMWGARRLGGRYITQIGVSIVGAMASNAIQIIIARYVIFGQAAWLIAPAFLVMGLVTGTALGLFAEHFARHSTWYSCAAGRMAALPIDDAVSAEAADTRDKATSTHLSKSRKEASEKARKAASLRRERYENYFSPWASAAGGALLALAFLFERTLAVKLAMFIFFIFAVHISGKKFSLPTMFIVSIGIILTNLLVPSGKVLLRLGPIAVTEFALIEGIMKALTFEGLMLISKASIMPGLKIPGTIGGIVGASFLYYDRIVEYKGKIRASSLAKDADAMMTEVWESESIDSGKSARAGGKTTRTVPKARTGYVILAFCTIAIYIFSLSF
jgi:heptaprenyl diphosphate synthase